MSFDSVYVIGGQQRSDRSMRELGEGWYGYSAGIILRVDSDGSVHTMLEYESPAGTHAPGDAILFKSATRRGDRLYCCTQTEVVVFSLPDFDQLAHLSLPRFNDVHHVLPTDRDTLLIANSGMETVVEVDPDGQVVDEWNVLGEDTWSLHNPETDYRLGVNLKPHRAHPNHLVERDGVTWVTRFERKDIVQVTDISQRVEIGVERIHDGVNHGELTYFTTVDGSIVGVDLVHQRVAARHVLDRGEQHGMLGWCRGLHFTGEDHCWVGFSRIRPTKLRQTVSWIRNGGTSQAPTRIARYRSDDWSMVDEIDLEPFGLSAVFSIVPVDVEG